MWKGPGREKGSAIICLPTGIQAVPKRKGALARYYEYGTYVRKAGGERL
jgi:hypothetical protein